MYAHMLFETLEMLLLLSELLLQLHKLLSLSLADSHILRRPLAFLESIPVVNVC